MRESIYPVVIGVLIVTVVAIYNIWSGLQVKEVELPGGSKITFEIPEKAPTDPRPKIVPNSQPLIPHILSHPRKCTPSLLNSPLAIPLHF